MDIFTIIVLFILAHFIADYTLQSDAMAKFKFKKNCTDQHPKGYWLYWLIAHACTHALAIYLITGNVWLTLIEMVLHFFIDWGKTLSYYQLHTDQLLHLVCKIGYILVLFL